ncbi:amidohydrolase family protein [Bizionia sp. M204]|uniref:amidohydrolase family protein n=1 Tax=Bizionia sp. M204 TaxID=2675331 RepID=UPI0020582CF6|nr:amidohydrolase family protein [Bizionia sp. M204]UPS91758.1 amidohydrolase family protein [Bizionia sp. M204]
MKNRTLIKNGLLFSGCQDEKAKIQDILILENGKIGNIGIIEADEEAHIIDAKGKWVVPGFVDSHTHYDAELIASPGLKESARHGVTSIILGVVQ